MSDDHVNSAVTYGLFAAWLLHDAEELAAGPRWIRETYGALELSG